MNKELDMLKRTVWEAESLPLVPTMPRVGFGNRLSRHKNGISGCACLLAGVLLLAVLVLKAKDAIITGNNLTVWIASLIIALYSLSKGVFTLLFYRKERRFEVSVHQYAILVVHNQLLFLYERMLWLWLLLPVLIGTVPAIISLLNGQNIGTMVYWFASAVVYVTLLLVCNPLLFRKYRRLRKELEEIQE